MEKKKETSAWTNLYNNTVKPISDWWDKTVTQPAETENTQTGVDLKRGVPQSEAEKLKRGMERGY